MTTYQLLFVFLYGGVALGGFLYATYRCRSKRATYSSVFPLFNVYGAFVAADLVILGFFWAIASGVVLLLQDWLLFLLIVSLFWLVRSSGETLYWFFQQFTPRKGNEPEKFLIHKIFRDDSVWFVIQVFWQCVTVATAISSLYIGKLWLAAIV